MRVSPVEGYDFGLKRQYRRDVWAAIRAALYRQTANAQALLMPSLEGDEIETALNNGFRECNLHVVDREPAIVATLKRRYRRINTYGCTASAAIQRISKAGITLAAANFDFCNKLGRVLFEEVKSIAECFPLARDGANHGAVLAFTVTRGREDRETTQYLQDVRTQIRGDWIPPESHRGDFERLALLSLVLTAALPPGSGCAHFRSGRYQSTLPMTWGAFFVSLAHCGTCGSVVSASDRFKTVTGSARGQRFHVKCIEAIPGRRVYWHVQNGDAVVVPPGHRFTEPPPRRRTSMSHYPAVWVNDWRTQREDTP